MRCRETGRDGQGKLGGCPVVPGELAWSAMKAQQCWPPSPSCACVLCQLPSSADESLLWGRLVARDIDVGSHSCKTLFAPAETHFLIHPLVCRVGRGFRGPASLDLQSRADTSDRWGHARAGQPHPSSRRCVWSRRSLLCQLASADGCYPESVLHPVPLLRAEPTGASCGRDSCPPVAGWGPDGGLGSEAAVPTAISILVACSVFFLIRG